MNAKRFLTCATLFAGLLLLNAPLKATVQSDIVGYTTIAMEAGKWYQVGNPFVSLNGDTVETINDVFIQGFAEGDILYLYNTDATTYYTPVEWLTYEGKTGWWDTDNVIMADIPLDPGQSVFIHKKTTGTVKLSGKVSATEVTTIGNGLANTWSQFVCQYPKDMSLNDMEWSGLTEGDKAYKYNTNAKTYDTPVEWLTHEGVTGWWDTDNVVLDSTVIPAGHAIFLFKQGAKDATCKPKQ